MTQTQPVTHQSNKSNHEETLEQTLIDRILQKLFRMELRDADHLHRYMRHKWRLNHKPRTLFSSFTSTVVFLTFCQSLGKSVEEITREDLEAFIEHEQDRGLNISTVRTRMASITAFLHYLMEQDVIPGAVLKRKIKLRLPDTLPRAMNPSDVPKLLSGIDTVRDRALILLLLRTGIRIGEALGLTLNDLDMRDRKVHLYQGEKNSMGRVVYISDDVLFALKRWCVRRDTTKAFLFYGKGDTQLSYSAARSRFALYLRKAGLDHKGYTVHCLRHTFASELLNAGMRLECLQQLLGHQDIEVTRRYARLTDRTREEEYFRAMAIIEQGGIDGTY
jgi:integrase/recombinase XerD